MGYSNEIIVSTYSPPPIDWTQLIVLGALIGIVVLASGIITTK